MSISAPHKEDLVADIADVVDDPSKVANRDEGDPYFKAINKVRQNLNPSSWVDEMEHEEQVPKQKNIPFRYLQSWGEELEFRDLIARSWGKLMYATPLFSIMLKLRRLKAEIKGLGIHSLGEVNKAMLYKIHWVFQQGPEEWPKFLKSKFSSKSGDTIRYYKPSTLWKGIKIGATYSKTHIGWLIGDG
ncbi:hypothetical protein GIB67_034303 [Kingdonia uniflora]|uniref:Uncharacterized protein n=1 Tax=Kingdonia uniflora TaxID=39325 RepID=A0A7J7NRT3_9MAGN|nr:hypothetical protein GIB67_034303 [Kingdonia uniflora]